MFVHYVRNYSTLYYHLNLNTIITDISFNVVNTRYSLFCNFTITYGDTIGVLYSRTLDGPIQKHVEFEKVEPLLLQIIWSELVRAGVVVRLCSCAAVAFVFVRGLSQSRPVEN